MKENFKPIDSYQNENGQINNPEIAEKMAYTEKPFRENKRKFGPLNLKPSKKQIAEGEKKAEDVGESLYKKLEIENKTESSVEEFSTERTEKENAELFNFTFKVDGHEITLPSIFLNSRKIIISREDQVTLDGEKMSSSDRSQIMDKYNDFIIKKIKEFKNDNPTTLEKFLNEDEAEKLVDDFTVERTEKENAELFNFTFKVDGHEITLPSIFLNSRKIIISREDQVTLDGEKMKSGNRSQIMEKYTDFIIKKIKEFKDDNPTTLGKIMDK
jgi:glutaredoxin